MAEKTTTPNFRPGHLVRLYGFKHAVLDGKLVRVRTYIRQSDSKHKVDFLTDTARPPIPAVPLRWMDVKSEHMQHVCEYCLAVAAEGVKLQICGKCKTAHYCNAECQHADWPRHQRPYCLTFSLQRGTAAPLHNACGDGNLAEVRRLVEEEGADVNKATTNGPTPLWAAANYDRLAVVRYLVEQGADVDKARVTSFTPLYGASSMGHLPIVRYLVEHGADMDKTDARGMTPIYAAASAGHLAVVQYLVQQGADINKENENGFTPMMNAWVRNQVEVVAYLRAAGATSSDRFAF